MSRVVLKVEIRSSRDYYDLKRCRWLGHSSYKCAACKLGYIRAKSDEDHDSKCADCGVEVVVSKEYVS